MTTNSIVILRGSPRRKGNSALLADWLSAGASEAGATVEDFFLHEMDIRPCDACDSCHETGGVCVIKDDMQRLYPKLERADAIVIASPIYWFTFSAQTKLCIDRWYALEIPHGNRLKGKRFGILLTYGDSDPYNSGAVNAIHTLQSMCGYLGAEIVGIVYGSAGEAGQIAQQSALLEKAYRLGQKLVAGETL